VPNKRKVYKTFNYFFSLKKQLAEIEEIIKSEQNLPGKLNLAQINKSQMIMTKEDSIIDTVMMPHSDDWKHALEETKHSALQRCAIRQSIPGQTKLSSTRISISQTQSYDSATALMHPTE
jgi:CRISPR/Cas system-associated endonuclease/helicase Cas3